MHGGVRRQELAEPRPCWVHWDHRGSTGPGRPAMPAILLEWRRVDTTQGEVWEGLVAFARGGGEHAWALEMRWVRAAYLRPGR
ncbi:hypothetical protein [uncultured Nocardioides sp.]|uniref:hypothetical protein n=1 Tax=uncultured Nocardioides sp. TaxID=198441 RepID=UPI00261C476C|nr:hypothetical protein [uncultured Nocardioides sp.]